MANWEYRFDHFETGQCEKIVSNANNLARRGWRLISITQDDNGGRTCLVAYFEREIPKPLINSVASAGSQNISELL